MTSIIRHIVICITFLLSTLSYAKTTWVPINVGDITTFIPHVPSTNFAAPSNVQISTNGGVSRLSWADVEHASRYEIQALNASGEWISILITDELSVVIDSRFIGYSSIRIMACTYNSCTSTGGWSSTLPIGTHNSEPTQWLAKEGIVDEWAISNVAPLNSDFVGAINGSASVSGGAANYQIPIALPPGRNNIQPNVALNYSSRSGRGIAGVGWSLSAGSAITRCPATLAQDAFSHGVTYAAATDKLCLNGQRLVPKSSADAVIYGQNNAQYTTEIDSFITVTQNGEMNATGSSFTVKLANGHTQIFGASAAERVVPTGAPATLTWLITNETDVSGTTKITYSYHNFGDGEVLLNDIDYQGGRHVSFSYEDAGAGNTNYNYNTSYLAGGKTRQTQRLSVITTYEAATTKVRDYSFNYAFSTATNRLLLTSVEECGHKGAMLCREVSSGTATAFDYSDNASVYNLERLQTSTGEDLVPVTNLLPSMSVSMARGDIDGNGSLDWPSYFTNAEGDNTGTNTFDYTRCNLNRITGTRSCIDADFNLDGLTDSWEMSNGALKVGYTNVDTLTTDWATAGETAVDLSHVGTTAHELVNIADFNADGWPDVVVHEAKLRTDGTWSGDVYLYLHTRSVGAPYSSSANKKKLMTSLHVNESLQYVGDMDGDGLPDLAFSELATRSNDLQPTMTALLLTRMSANGTLSFDEVDLNINARSGLNSYENFSMLIDVNADGLNDWIGWLYGEGAALYLRLNQGGGAFSAPQSLNYTMRQYVMYLGFNPEEPEYVIIPKFMDAFKQMDIDGDGRTELIMPGTADSDILVEGCYTFYEVKGSRSSKVTRCGRDISKPYRMDRGSIARVNPPSSWDRNIYKYKALKFSEDSAGNYSASLVNTDLVGSANHSTVVDALGTGLSDLVFSYGCEDTSCSMKDNEAQGVMSGKTVNKLYFNRNYGATENTSTLTKDDYRAIDMMKSATNGLGNTNSWTYRPLSSQASGANFYSPNHGGVIDDAHFHFSSSMYVVDSFKQSNGVNTTPNNINYRYEGAMYNSQGRGFRGFFGITEIDTTRGIRTETSFEQKFPFSSLVKTQQQFDDNRTVPFSIVENQWLANDNHTIPTAYNNYNASSVSISCDVKATSCDASNYLSRTDTVVAQENVDQYGNISERITTVQDDYGAYQTTQEAVYDGSESWPHKMSSQKVTKHAIVRKSASIAIDTSADVKTWVQTHFTWNTTHRKPSNVSITTSDSSQAAATATIYNSFGLPTTITATGSGQARKTKIGYSADSFFATSTTKDVTASNKHVYAVTMDKGTGQVTQAIDAAGVVVDTLYDAFGRPIQVDTTGAQTQYLRYRTPDGNRPNSNAVMMSVVTQAGSPEITAYQDMFARNLRTRTRDFNGDYVFQDTGYNAKGFKVSETNVHSGSPLTTSYKHDVLGRITQKTAPTTNEGILTTNYAHNNLTTTVTLEGLSMTRTYNALKQLMHTSDALDGETEYAYDSRGNPIVIEDANDNRITAKYDALGRKTWVDDPNMGKTSFTYNAFGEVTSEKDANSSVISYNLDTLGRVDSRSASGSTASFVWDTLKKGLLTSQTQNGISQSFVYDNAARVKQATMVLDGKSFSTLFNYHTSSGQLASMQYPNDLVVGYQYNSDGYLTREYNAATDYTYREITAQNNAGQIIAATLGNAEANIRQTMTYSPATGQMLTSNAKGKVLGSISDIHNLSYQYDSFGNVIDQYNHLADFNAHDSYAYDDLQRLKSSTINASMYNGTINYAYDAVGNLTKKSDYSTNVVGAYSYNNDTNQVNSVALAAGGTATFGYDNKGNQTHRNGMREVTYNAFNKPTIINKNNASLSFVYGADLMRAKQSRTVDGVSTTTYYVDKHYELEESNGHWRESIYLGDVAIIRDGDQVGDKSIRFTLRDRLGSTSTFADHNGYGTSYRYFDPFGKPRGGDWSPLGAGFGLAARLANNPYDTDMATRRGFTDHEHLDEAELIHMNGRVYDYNLGRFMSVDPFIQSPTNSQSMNPYSYIMNNPLSGTDPTGYIGEQEDKVEVKEEKVDVAGSRLKGTKTTKTTTKADGSVTQRTTISNGAGQFTSSSNRSGSIESNDNTKIGDQKGISTNQGQTPSSNTTTTSTDDEGNPVTPVNVGVAVGGVAAGIADVNGADILKPKQNVTHHKNPTLNKPRIGIAKSADEVLVNIKDAGKTASKVLAVAGIAVTTAEAIVDIRNPTLSQDQKIGSGLKAATDVGVILASGAIGGPVGLGLAASYLVADYIFDFKSGIQDGVKHYRREEENQ